MGGTTTNLSYDPLTRLIQVPGPTYTTQFAYDGLDLIAEYYSGSLVGRHVLDPTTGQPLVTYLSGDTSTRMFLSPDERGSIMANTNNAGGLVYGDPYDEFGQPMPWNQFRYQYTGQAWLSEVPGLKLYYYKARMYSPVLGRFMQTDPIGYGAAPNMYAYVLNDPVNLIDTLGLEQGLAPGYVWCGRRCSYDPAVGVVVTGTRTGKDPWVDPFAGIAPLSWLIGRATGVDQLLALSSGILSGNREGGGQAERKISQCSPHPILGAVGKVWGGANTVVGLIAAAGSSSIGRFMGYEPTVKTGNNAIQVLNAWTFNDRAYTIGNVQVYAPGRGPDVVQRSYSGATVNVGMHEEAHTIQSQLLGPLYLPTIVMGGLRLGKANPLETGADRYARGNSCVGL